MPYCSVCGNRATMTNKPGKCNLCFGKDRMDWCTDEEPCIRVKAFRVDVLKISVKEMSVLMGVAVNTIYEYERWNNYSKGAIIYQQKIEDMRESRKRMK